jgi:hypothetical protein
MNSVTLEKCEHPACHCLVERKQKYCSSACANAAQSREIETCSCGHPGCETARKFVEDRSEVLKRD